MESTTGIFLSAVRTPFYGWFQKLNKNKFLWIIVLFGAKTPVASTICQTFVAFTYFVSLNAFFILLREKKSIKLERPLCKNKSSQEFHKCLSCRNFLWSFITLVNLRDKRVSVCQGCNDPVKNNELPFPPPCNLVVVIKRCKGYFKDRKRQMFGPSNVYFHLFHENLFTFPFKCVQRRLITFRMDSAKFY